MQVPVVHVSAGSASLAAGAVPVSAGAVPPLARAPPCGGGPATAAEETAGAGEDQGAQRAVVRYEGAAVSLRSSQEQRAPEGQPRPAGPAALQVGAAGSLPGPEPQRPLAVRGSSCTGWRGLAKLCKSDSPEALGLSSQDH
ncbi:uncharacterized protein LOC121328700 isoform X2 [Polyodon spathula]|uniref:uncharacterized protein LOC121328700 isoform X2 n=1 Tax=Polyodon spathula TaxID=7913 RepID=UPI001B7E3BDE|nr:uncharacterized protein LOC121328700 isoform X2 [Polyodon spathula]